MNPVRLLGVVLLAVGALVLVLGMNSSHSFADQLSNTFTGHFTDRTTWYILGGSVCGILGLSMLFLGQRGKNA